MNVFASLVGSINIRQCFSTFFSSRHPFRLKIFLAAPLCSLCYSLRHPNLQITSNLTKNSSKSNNGTISHVNKFWCCFPEKVWGQRMLKIFPYATFWNTFSYTIFKHVFNILATQKSKPKSLSKLAISDKRYELFKFSLFGPYMLKC